MTGDQYSRASRQSLITVAVTQAAILLIIIGSAVIDGWQTKSTIELTALLLGTVLSVYGYVKKRTEHLGASMIMLGVTASYVTMMFMEKDTSYIILAFPMIITAITYLLRRLLAIGCGVTLGCFFIVFLQGIFTQSFDRDDLVLLIMTAVAVYSAMTTSKMLRTFNEENNEKIESHLRETEATNQALIRSAGNISARYEDAEGALSDLKGIINSNRESMEEIAGSTESTAEAVQAQAVRSQEIQTEAETTEEARKEMLSASEEARGTIQNGLTSMKGLEESTDAVQSASASTVDATKAVTDKVEEVKEIVGEIIGISDQTNLLALNASIEAARAGEAGKGFAVVAEEIRKLSEQTQEASKKITGIIEELAEDARTAGENTEHTAETVKEQSELIRSVSGNFQSIDENVRALLFHFEKLGQGTQSIKAKTGEINDSISQLSASSEEVASLSNEGLESSKQAVQKFDAVSEALNALSEEADRLKETAEG